MVPIVSVVMPVYNSIKTLRRSIESILVQTFREFEFIIVNEFGSDDGSKEVLEHYAKIDGRVKLIQIGEKRIGIAESLNTGMRIAKGKYIARMDADDYAYPKRLEVQLAYMEMHPECTLCGGYVRWITSSGAHIVTYALNDEELQAGTIFECCFCHPTIIFRKSAWRMAGGYDPDYLCEDFELWTRIEGKKSNIPCVLLDYYVGNENSTVKLIDRVHLCSCEIVKKQLKERLQIQVEKYEDKWFWPYLINPQNDSIGDLFDGFSLLADIEEKNNQLHIYDMCALAFALRRQWMKYLARYDITFVQYDYGVGVPILPDYTGESFQKCIADSLGVSLGDVRLEIHKRLTNMQNLIYSVKKLDSRIIVFGIGEKCKKYFEVHNKIINRIIGFCDNNLDYIGGEFFGKPIISIHELYNLNYDLLVIASVKFFDEICLQLVNDSKVSENIIVPLHFLDYIDEG